MVQRYIANYPLLKGTLAVIILMVLNLLLSRLPEHINIIALYRSPQVPLTQLCLALQRIVDHSNNNIFIGDFNVNWLIEVERQSIYNVMVRDNGYRQLINNSTSDNNTLIDHIYTNIVNVETLSGNLETYFSDHKAIWISCKRT